MGYKPGSDRRKAEQRRYRAEWLTITRELHYVYCLVDEETRTVGYFGVTNNPIARARQHRCDAKPGTHRQDRKAGWRLRFG